MFGNDRLLGWIGRMAKWVYSKAAAILVISPGFRQNLVDKGVPPEKIHVISNWVDTETYHRAEPDPKLAQELGLAGRFNVMFAGNMGEAQGLETVIRAAKLLEDDPHIQFVMVGDGIALPRLQQLTEEQHLTNVRFLGRYPAQGMSRLYALADALLVHLKDDPLFRITIPHKILAYLGSGKPILAAVSGDVSDLVSATGAGVTCAPENPQALAAAVRSLQSMPDGERRAMGERGILTARTRYSRNALVGEIEAVLQQVARNGAWRP